MKKWLVLICLSMVIWSPAAKGAESPIKKLTTPGEKQAYAMAWDIGTALREMSLDFDFDRLAMGLRDGYRQKEPLLSVEEAKKIRKEFADSRHAKKAGETGKTMAATPIEDKVKGGKGKNSPATGKGVGKKGLTTPGEKLAYAMGLDIGNSLQKDCPGLDFAYLRIGLRDSYHGGNSLLSPLEIKQAKKELVDGLAENKKKKEERAKLVDRHLKEGLAFFEKNKSKAGVVVTASGLQYEIIVHGGGSKPAAVDLVTLKYRGTLLDGTEVQNTGKEEKTSVPVASLLPGLAEAVQLMPVGARYRVYVPARLAYGFNGAGNLIPPFACLIYEVELVEITPGPPVAAKSEVVPPVGEPVKETEDGEMEVDTSLHFSTLDDAAYAFYSTFNDRVRPNTNEDEVKELCVVVSAPPFLAGCQALLRERVRHLDELEVEGAQFTKGERLVDEAKKEVVVSWGEKLLLANKKIVESKRKMKINFVKVDKFWKVKAVKFQ